MTARDIVRDPNLLGGRWHFGGTNIAVAALRLDHRHNHLTNHASYRFMNLSMDEIASALTFDFPAIRESVLDVQYASVLMHCECGEQTSHATTWPDQIEFDCACGRTWLVEVTFRLLAQHLETASAD